MWRIIEEGVLFDGRAVLGISGAGQLLVLGHLLYASLWICNYLAQRWEDQRRNQVSAGLDCEVEGLTCSSTALST